MKCDKGLTFEECELSILRQAVDKIEQKMGANLINNPEVKSIIAIVEKFLIKTGRVCYGGTAINNILPEDEQFYDKSVELPDYDFFSQDPLNDAKKLADIFYAQGFNETEAKAGMHAGTFKVFVNYLPVADISFVPKDLYNKIKQKSINKGGIHYTPPNYLRMLMYLELSRPQGDAGRWEKVLKRLTILNRIYPLKGIDCDFIEIQRMFDINKKIPDKTEQNIFRIVRESLISQKVIFFGAMANKMYLFNNKKKHKKVKPIPDFDVLALDPETSANIVKRQLVNEGIKKVTIRKHPGVGEIIAPHFDVRINGESVVFIYEPLACHSYNVIHNGKVSVRIATLDTMLSFYLAFMYVSRPYYDAKRILCMSHYLFKVQQKHRLEQKGILRRFSIDCYGEEKHTKEKVRAEKTIKYKQLRKKRGTEEWDYYFLNYKPSEQFPNTDEKTREIIGKKRNTVKRHRTKTNKQKTRKKRSEKRGLLYRLLRKLKNTTL